MKIIKVCGFVVWLWSVSAGVQSASFQEGDALTASPISVDFESMAAGYVAPATYSQNGITVKEIGGGIHTTLIKLDGQRSWAAARGLNCGESCTGLSYTAGSSGYTEITRQDGSDFFNLSLMLGSSLFDSGIPLSLEYWFELYNGADKVGAHTHTSSAQGFWFSVLGGGFDAVRLGAYDPAWKTNGDVQQYNYLVIDNIKAVPVPATIWLFISGIAGFVASKSFKKKRSMDRQG